MSKRDPDTDAIDDILVLVGRAEDENVSAEQLMEEMRSYRKTKLEARIDRLLAEVTDCAYVLEDDWLGPAFDLVRMKLGRLALKLGADEDRPNAKKRQKIPAGLRRRVLERDEYRCVKCGSWHKLHIDHIVPVSKGGPTKIDNLQVLCQRCNLQKGNRQ